MSKFSAELVMPALRQVSLCGIQQPPKLLADEAPDEFRPRAANLRHRRRRLITPGGDVGSAQLRCDAQTCSQLLLAAFRDRERLHPELKPPAVLLRCGLRSLTIILHERRGIRSKEIPIGITAEDIQIRNRGGAVE